MRPVVPLRRRLPRLAPLLLLLLVACSGEELVLTRVLPSPALPGQALVAYGAIPAGARLTLSGVELAAAPSAGGLGFTLPESTLAGLHEVAVTVGGRRQALPLSVRPRLDGATLDGDALRLRGAGWPAEPSSSVQLVVEVDGRGLAAEVAAGELRATLPDDLLYGDLVVRARVAGEASEALVVRREAGAATGVVRFPGAGPAARALLPAALPGVAAPVENTALVAVHAPGALAGATWPGLRERAASPALGASRLAFADRAAAEAARAALLRRPGVRAVEWDALVRTDGAALAPAAAPPAAGAGQWHLDLLGVRDAWSGTRGEGVVVAVVDTGVDLDHPDLAARLLPGHDFVDDDAQPDDLAGHGTHVAGLVAADGQALGTAPGARLLPVRVLEGEAGGSAFAVAQGVLWAAGLLSEPANANPAAVINLSLGSAAPSSVLESAVRQALDAGVLVVAAAGNSGGTLAYPAAYPGVVAVTAVAGPILTYQPWYASHGAGTWLSGYGGDETQDQDGDGVSDGVLSTDLAGGYRHRMGTSMASPQVAGLAALALAAGTPPGLLRDSLARSATDLGPLGRDGRYGWGLATARGARPSAPRAYVVALDGAAVVAWTLVAPDGTYRLDHLPVGRPLALVAASDEDGDGVLGEAGELVSAAVAALSRAGEALSMDDLTLTVSDGSAAMTLEVMP